MELTDDDRSAMMPQTVYEPLTTRLERITAMTRNRLDRRYKNNSDLTKEALDLWFRVGRMRFKVWRFTFRAETADVEEA